MILFIVLAVTELFTPVVLRQHFYMRSKAIYYILIIAHLLLSFWLWILFIEVKGDKGFYDSPRHIWSMMQLNGMIAGVVIPRIFLILFHFSGRFLKRKTGAYINWLTNTGFAVSIVIFLVIAGATLKGRFNFRTDELEIRIKGLNPDLDGLRIVQISDLHLAGFHHHRILLEEQMKAINRLDPDLVLNTGDFITYGWHEFNNLDTILSIAKGRYGAFAIMGNHDFGTYHPYFTDTDRANNTLIINQDIKKSGYKILNDEHTVIKIGNASIGLIGITTAGRYPDIVYGDLDRALMDLDSVDMQILLSHDPNHWQLAVEGKTYIDLTLSGHTHGMQMGIYTDRIKWSPAKYFYPHWSGLYSTGDQYHYVNRGLGVLSVPFRIWMPPEITLIILKTE